MQQRLFEGDNCTIGQSGELIFNGVDLGRLAREYETPYYLISENILRANCRRFMAGFEGVPGFRVYYSVKTNYESGVLQCLRDLGFGVEISGGLDLLACRRAGFQPEDIVFDGPCKSEEELRQAIDLGIHLINVESELELQTIDRLARERGRIVPVGIRIDPIVKNPSYSKLISTYKQKFGFPIDRCDSVFELANRCKNVQVVGLHAHIGSQILSPELYVKNLSILFELAARLKKNSLNILEVNIGGGFPAPSTRHLRVSRRMKGAELLDRINLLEARPPEIGEFGRSIQGAYEEACRRWDIRPILATEPGRSLVSNTCVVIGRVRVIKDRWVFTDISINDVPENLFFSEFRVFFPGKMRENWVKKAHLSGPTLATNDVILFETAVPELQAGDPIAIFDTGAYSITRANQFTRPRSAVYFLRSDGRIEVIRRRERPEDVLSMQVWNGRNGAGVFREEAVAVAGLSA
ncbi:alanine racemase [Candidatus Methylomirabilis sp.]|uniref:diaminopimelate decarboxylase family protein n=1 Tax=Candidatus Methylomirabilis sp. TaxID=2032687 RepID=UPI0030762C0C